LDRLSYQSSYSGKLQHILLFYVPDKTSRWLQQPQLEQTLSAEVVEALFSVSPSENSGRNQVQLGDDLYAMVFRKISK
jgi:hypothetical protein